MLEISWKFQLEMWSVGLLFIIVYLFILFRSLDLDF